MKTALMFATIAIAASAADAPRGMFIDPASRWISIHDSKGTGAKAEITLDFIKACPAILVAAETRESADYSVLIDRTGVSAGSVVIYAHGAAVYSFKPGHTATLRKVAERICGWVRTQH